MNPAIPSPPPQSFPDASSLAVLADGRTTVAVDAARACHCGGAAPPRGPSIASSNRSGSFGTVMSWPQTLHRARDPTLPPRTVCHCPHCSH